MVQRGSLLRIEAIDILQPAAVEESLLRRPPPNILDPPDCTMSCFQFIPIIGLGPAARKSAGNANYSEICH